MIYSAYSTDFLERFVRKRLFPTKTDGRFPVWVTLLISERDIGIRNRVFLRKKYYGYRCNEHKTGSI